MLIEKLCIYFLSKFENIFKYPNYIFIGVIKKDINPKHLNHNLLYPTNIFNYIIKIAFSTNGGYIVLSNNYQHLICIKKFIALVVIMKRN